MWLHRVIYNFQTRLLGRNEFKSSKREPSKPNDKPALELERAQIVQDRLLDLDRRLAELR